MTSIKEWASDVQEFFDAEGYTVTLDEEDCMLEPCWFVEWNEDGVPKRKIFYTLDNCVKYVMKARHGEEDE